MFVQQRRFLAVLLVGVSVSLVMAQQPRPARKAPRGIYLEGSQRLRYICGQVDLTDSQKSDLDAFVAVYDEMMKEEQKQEVLIDRLMKIQGLTIQLKEARDAGNREQEKQIQAQITELTPGRAAERTFFESVEQTLNDEQKKQLAAARARLTANRDASLKPMEVIQLARTMELNPDQRKKLDEVLRDFRGRAATLHSMDLFARLDLVDALIKRVGGILTDEQRKTFMARIERLQPPRPQRPNAAAPKKPVRTISTTDHSAARAADVAEEDTSKKPE